MDDLSPRTKKNRQDALDQVLEYVVRWYMENDEHGRLPTEIVKIPRPYKGRVDYYFEPPLLRSRHDLKGELTIYDNPVVVEEYVGAGDQWSVRIERREK